MQSKADRITPPLFAIGAVGIWLYALYVSILQNSVLVKGGPRYFFLDEDQMISMRYARNWAEGNGVVYNVGERVEGYTNPLWVLVMAVVHKIGFGDSSASLVVKLINIALLLALVFVCDKIYSKVAPTARLTFRVVNVLSILFCHNVLYWCVHGFETTLLTLLFVLVALFTIDDFEKQRLRWSTVALITAIPLVRSDYWPVWMPVALTCLWHVRTRRTLAVLSLSLIPTVLHFLWRRAYYGEWFPNTYYLKVKDIPGRPALGLEFLKLFFEAYGVLLAVGVFVVLVMSSAKLRPLKTLLLSSIAISLGYNVYVGGDVFLFRSLSFFMPLLLLAICCGAETAAEGNDGRWMTIAAGVVSLVTVIQPAFAFLHDDKLANLNGRPLPAAMSGIFLRANAPPELKIATVGAGLAPYFSHLYTHDLLGKTERHIAHLVPKEGCDSPGHCKYDYDYSYATAPDVILGYRNCERDRHLSWPEGTDYPISGARQEPPAWAKAQYRAKDFRTYYFENCFAPNGTKQPIWSYSIRTTSVPKVESMLKATSPF